ncbi:Bug family tripartite tricarboxylate transporter substrate binding protein [Elioraea sp.]|uniref:Bug family tripartite tricarboxylate transporter substrate binding protein n=1 Tax=Elioraea sp. TaxID=2185103 RepID=UPI003F6EB2FF
MNAVFRVAMLALAVMALPGAPAAAWPERPVRLIVPFAPGGGTDLLGRSVAASLQDRLGQPFVVENRPGAGGTIGTASVARAAPDGYTLVVGFIATHAIGPALYPNAGYDPVRDFACVATLATAPNILVVHPTVPAQDARMLASLARERPDSLAYGSAGIGSPAHLTGLLFARATAVSVQHVPYRGGAPAVADLVAGRLQFMFAGPVETLPHVREGRLRALAVTTPHRSALAPDLPTMTEAGIPEVVLQQWFVLCAPAGTGAAILARLTAATDAALADAALRQRLTAAGLEPAAERGEAAQRFVAEEAARWGALVRSAGLKLE